MNTNRFQAPREKGQKPTGKRWFMLSLIFVLTAINYLDRTNMAVAAPSMSAELGFSACLLYTSKSPSFSENVELSRC